MDLARGGRGVRLDLGGEQQQRRQRLLRLHGFDQMASDVISVRRRLPDTRPQQCQQQTFGELPEVSVIISFYNEAWSVLLRSLHSVLQRSPPQLLREVLLVDDCSDLEHLGAPLTRYVGGLGGRVRLVRSPARGGLAPARLLGARLARAPTLVFLDSHVECLPGWLEPLLDRVARNRLAVAWPLILTLRALDFQLRPAPEVKLGGLSQPSLNFAWIPLPPSLQGMPPSPNSSSPASLVRPLPSPTMPGGLFAIDAAWFSKLGGFDPDLSLWGGENLELSLKVWMCGGTVELVPCSRVGHVFRWRRLKPLNGTLPFHRNTLRVTEVWMDAYKVLFQGRFFHLRQQMGDVSERRRLRARLGCQDFRWYLQHVYPQLTQLRLLHFGQIESEAFSLCLEFQRPAPVLAPCNNSVYSQMWTVEEDGRIAHDSSCLLYQPPLLQLQPGFRAAVEAQWHYSQEKQQLYHPNSGQCLHALPDRPTLRSCLSASANQRWRLIAL